MCVSLHVCILILQELEAATAPPTEDGVEQKLEPYPGGIKVNTSNHRLMNSVCQPKCLYTVSAGGGSSGENEAA